MKTKTKRTARTGTESEKWTSCGGISLGRRKEGKGRKGKELYPRLLYPVKLSLITEGQIKCFPDKVKLKEFIITNLIV